MQHDQQVSMIVDELVEQGLIDGQHLQLKKMKGTTEGVVYILSEQGIPKFTLNGMSGANSLSKNRAGDVFPF